MSRLEAEGFKRSGQGSHFHQQRAYRVSPKTLDQLKQKVRPIGPSKPTRSPGADSWQTVTDFAVDTGSKFYRAGKNTVLDAADLFVQPVSGILDGAENMSDLALSMFPTGSYDPKKHRLLPEGPPPRTFVGSFLRTTGQLAPGMIPAGKAVQGAEWLGKGIKVKPAVTWLTRKAGLSDEAVTTAAAIGKVEAQGLLAEQLTFDPYEPGLANMLVEQGGMADNPLTRSLARRNEDSELVARLKMAGEGTLASVALATGLYGAGKATRYVDKRFSARAPDWEGRATDLTQPEHKAASDRFIPSEEEIRSLEPIPVVQGGDLTYEVYEKLMNDYKKYLIKRLLNKDFSVGSDGISVSFSKTGIGKLAVQNYRFKEAARRSAMERLTEILRGTVPLDGYVHPQANEAQDIITHAYTPFFPKGTGVTGEESQWSIGPS